MRIIHSLLTLTLISLLTTRLTHSQSHPEFSLNEYTGDIAENAALSTLVLTVAATDSDGDAITFSLQGETHNYFNLNPTTGALTVQNELDREAVDFIDFEVSLFIIFTGNCVYYSDLGSGN